MSQDAPIPMELWELIPPAAQAALRAYFDSLHKRIAALEQQVAALTARLEQNSHNSSKPPSSDGPNVKRRPPRKPSGKKRGGQPGHEKQERPLLPPNETAILKPKHCRRCGHKLTGDDPHPLLHQVLELPEIKRHVVHYLLHRLRCADCGASTCAALPKGVPTGHQGPRLQALLALLSGAYRLSKRQIETLCDDVFTIPLCTGTICNLEQQTAAATEPVVQELRDHVRKRHANMDETGWREQGKKAWLWVLVTAAATIFHIDRSRGGKVARFLLGPGFHWVITSDRFSAYLWLGLEYRQVCWAHLRRDFQGIIDRGGASVYFGKALLQQSDKLFTLWYRVRDGTLKRSGFDRRIAKVRAWVRYFLTKGSECACAKTASLCREILRLEPALWTFTRLRGIEPTNNAAERALRHAVQWRKTSYGTDSVVGSHFVANILSVVATCRQQNRNVLDFLHHCCQTHLHANQAPSLLPGKQKKAA
jgi:transposase